MKLQRKIDMVKVLKKSMRHRQCLSINLHFTPVSLLLLINNFIVFVSLNAAGRGDVGEKGSNPESSADISEWLVSHEPRRNPMLYTVL